MDKEYIEAIMQNSFGVDGKFSFRCTACGKCCKRREDILLSPYDIHRIAGYLGMEMGEVVQKYCICYVGHDSMIPVVAVGMKGPEKVCPFLESNKCAIHEAKPTVCALFPLGRFGKGDGKAMYFLQDVDCGKKDEVHTVREWLAGFGMEKSEEWFQAWNAAVMEVVEKAREIIPKVSENLAGTIENALMALLYCKYPKDADFMEQFQKNMKAANALLDTTNEMFRI